MWTKGLAPPAPSSALTKSMVTGTLYFKKKIPRQQWTANSTLRRRNKGDSTRRRTACLNRKKTTAIFAQECRTQAQDVAAQQSHFCIYLFLTFFFFKHQVHLIPEVTPTVDLVRCFIYNAFFYKHEKKGWPFCNSFSFKLLIRRPDEDRWQTSCVRSYIPMVLTCQKRTGTFQTELPVPIPNIKKFHYT